MARILVIDDDKAIRTVIRLTLINGGHTVVEACNGKEGLALFAQAKPDLLITDIIMPEAGGLEVLMELRRKFLSVPSIAISGGGRLTAPQYLHMTKLIGVTKVLQKPFSVDALTAAVSEVLANGSASLHCEPAAK